MTAKISTIILISADAEWCLVRELFPKADIQTSPYGEWFQQVLNVKPTVVMQGGWGKVAASGSAQYAIDRWQPELLVNLGTCGGFAGYVERGQIILAQRTVMYDIIEQMLDADQAIQDRSVEVDLSWLKSQIPENVLPTTLVSADRDILPADIPILIEKYHAVAADWESGAIAWVAQRNSVRCLILRGVTDLVGTSGGEIYGDYAAFAEQTRAVMVGLFDSLDWWLN